MESFNSLAVSEISSGALQHSRQQRRGVRSTRLAFFIAGFALASWAPLVPYAQARLQVDAALLGTVLLCLGLGAVLGMPLASLVAGRLGAKPAILAGAVGLILSMPILALAPTPILLGLCLVLFGASIGAIDVAANVHGLEVQQRANRPLMSNFHGMYSLGGLVGAITLTGLLTAGLSVVVCTLFASTVILCCVLVALTDFLSTRPEHRHPMVVVPKGSVVAIGALLFVIFLAEGAMLDWSAILLSQHKNIAVSQAGIGYAVFAVAMGASRLIGDKLVSRLGEQSILIYGFLMTGFGIALLAWARSGITLLAAVVIAGFAAGNIVPALFHLTGRQRVMPPQQAVAAVSILGYLGILAGPGVIGHAAHYLGLLGTFYALATLLVLAIGVVPVLCARLDRG